MAGRVNTKFVVSLSLGLLLAFGVVAASAYYLLVNSAADLAKAGDRLVEKADPLAEQGRAEGGKARAEADQLSDQARQARAEGDQLETQSIEAKKKGDEAKAKDLDAQAQAAYAKSEDLDGKARAARAKAREFFAKGQTEYAKAIEFYSKAVNKEPTNATNLNKWRDTLKKMAPELQVSYQDYFRQYLLATSGLARVQRDNIDVQRENLDIQREATSADQVILESDAMLNLHAGEPAGGKADTLKRYRGMARLQRFAAVVDSKPEVATQAEADLKDALKADPADTEAAEALRNLYLVMAQRAEARSATDEVKALVDKADAVLTEFLAKNPNDPYMQLLAMQRRIGRFQQDLREQSRGGKIDMAKVTEESKTLGAELQASLRATAETIKKADPELITPKLVNALWNMESLVGATSGSMLAEEVCRKKLATRPNDSQMLSTLASVLATRNDYAGAVDELQRIADLDLPTTSLEGVRLLSLRNDARLQQAFFQAKACLSVPAEGRAKALAEARKFRAQLEDFMAKDSPPLKFVDAQLAFAEGDFQRANQLIDQYLRAASTRPVPEALFLGAQIAERINQPGLAKQRLDQYMKLTGDRLSGQAWEARLLLAVVETQLQNFDRALEIYDQILLIAPNNTSIREQRDRVAIGAKGGGSETSDAVARDLFEAEKLIRPAPGKPAKPDEFVPFLEAAVVRHNYDWRIVQPLCVAYVNSGRREKAVELANKCFKLHPDVRQAQMLQIGFSQPDGPETQIAMIDLDTTAPAIDRALGHYQVYRRWKIRDKAAAALADAAKVNPNDARVIESQFLDALETKSFQTAETLAAKAKAENLDDLHGALYAAQLLEARGNLLVEEGSDLARQAKSKEADKKYAEAKAAFKDAIETMQQAMELGGAGPEAWLIKGRMETRTGRGEDALASFRQAVNLRPSDPLAIGLVLQTLVDLGRQEEALTFARASEKFGRNDPTFVSRWLNLEAAIGNRTVAQELRETMAKISPNERQNLVALASMYLANREWVKARTTIDSVKKLDAEQKLDEVYDTLTLEATWHWEQGDKASARKVFDSYIAAIEPAKMTVKPLVAYAEFLYQEKDVEATLAQLEKARAYQDEKVAQADKMISNVYMYLRAYDQVAEVCRRIVTAKADTPNLVFQKRLAEALIALGNYSDAKAEVEKISSTISTDVVTQLLLADCQGGLKDPKQRETLDEAVRLYGNQAIVFVKRAQFQMGDPKTVRDAVTDYTKALQLQPQMWEAYNGRAQAYFALEQFDEAIKDLSAALKIQPYNDDLFYGLMADLLRKGRVAEAVDIATRTLPARPRDLDCRMTLGQIFARVDAHQEACRFFKDAFELDTTSSRVAQRYLDSLLAMEPPDLNEALRVLNTLGSQRVQGNPGLLLALAKVLIKQGKVQPAEAAARDALKLLDVTNSEMMLAWFNDLRKLITDKKQMLRYLDETARMAQAAAAQEWMAYFRTVVNLVDPATRNETIGPARELLGRAKDEAIRQSLVRVIGSALYETGDFEETAKQYRDGLGQFPDDVELNNNLAFILATHLGKPEDAEPLAEKAAKAVPGDPNVLDTLGSVKLLLKKCDEATNAFRRASLLASSPDQIVRYRTHLAEALVCAGDRAGARAALIEAIKLVEKDPSTVTEKAKADLAATRKKTEGT